MIVQVIYNKFTPEMRRVVRKLRKFHLIDEILFYKGDRNLILADGLLAWEEGKGDPIDGIYDITILKRISEINPQISG
ncbi:hypothetical protein GWK48_08950 [Metallosphaera tengchongensis]|uniref:Uncharacterized protein n=1 Tax=Metallosphaera tengchongensis TaxID=1532350 RepID=A0A6N0NUR6_9CREN|nr:hypothetical protein [Metallosphaera tengchongensis]QKR00482.1 hypothetical protein GWK48_08950 [Metallosphaera tengchongensis]